MVFSLLVSLDAAAQEAPLIRFGRGFAAEEQVWLMSARPDLTPSQGKKYQLKQILFQANPERFQAYLAGELDGGTAAGLAVIFARAQGVDMKIVASVCTEAASKEWFSTTYMAKDDGPVRSVKDLKGGTIGVVGIKTATDLWARGLSSSRSIPRKWPKEACASCSPRWRPWATTTSCSISGSARSFSRRSRTRCVRSSPTTSR